MLCFIELWCDVNWASLFVESRPDGGGVQPQLRELREAQPAGAAAVTLQTDGGAHHLPHLHRQPHQAGVPVRPRLLHRLQRRAQKPAPSAGRPSARGSSCSSDLILQPRSRTASQWLRLGPGLGSVGVACGHLLCTYSITEWRGVYTLRAAEELDYSQP